MPGRGASAYIGVDIGGTNVRAALVSDAGAILLHERWPTEIHLGQERFLDRLVQGLAALRSRGTTSGIAVAAIGVGVPGLIARTGVVHSSVNLEPIEGVDLKEVVVTATGLPVMVINDANAAAFGEYRHGAGRLFTSLLMFTLGTGVGSGLILDGALWTGIDGVAAEYGHATVEPEGFPCRCGNRGCLEQYASATALVRAANIALQIQEGGMLADIPSGGISAETIAAAAHRGDPLARTLFEEAGRYLGIAVASAANLLNIEAIIIGGGVSASFDLFAAAMRREVDRRAFAILAARLAIRPGELGDVAGILGAAALARELVNNAAT
jgi:glucokinase